VKEDASLKRSFEELGQLAEQAEDGCIKKSLSEATDLIQHQSWKEVAKQTEAWLLRLQKARGDTKLLQDLHRTARRSEKILTLTDALEQSLVSATPWEPAEKPPMASSFLKRSPTWRKFRGHGRWRNELAESWPSKHSWKASSRRRTSY
jgi:hypothetical protein